MSLRDLFVNVDIQDGASAPLTRINSMVDRLINNLQRAGNATNNTVAGFRNLNNATSRLSSNINQSTRETSSLNRQLDASESEARGLRNELQRTERELSEARDEASQMRDRLGQAEREAEDLRQEMQRVERASDRTKTSVLGIGSALRGMVGIVGTVFAVDRIKDFATSGIELAAGTKALNSQFEQVFGDMEKTAATNLNSIAEQTGILPDRLKGSFVQMAAFAKTTGADTAAAMSLAERATLAAADSAAFYDRGIEDVTENIQSLLKGNFENDASLGISVTETTRNAAAMKLFNKEFKKLNEEQKQLTLLQMVEDGNKAAGAIGQAARESDGFENVIGNLKGAWDGLKGTMMTPFLDTVTGGLQDLTSKIQSVDAEQLGLKLKSGFEGTMDVVVPTFNAVKDGINFIQDNKEPLIAGLAGITAGFVAMKVISTVSGLMTLYQGSAFAATFATHGFNAALRANPIGMVVTAIGLLVAGGVALYRNWDTVKLKAGELWATTKEKFAGIKSSVSDFVQPAITWFDSLSTKWTNFKNSLTSFKMPGWMSSIGGAISGAASKLSGLVNGSHATGLANVPFDGYRAELHKGESVLTAEQSNSLRSVGILSANGNGTPNLDFSGLPKVVEGGPTTNAAPAVTTNNETYSSQTDNSSISVPVNLSIAVHATGEKVERIKNRLSELEPIVRQIVSNMLDEELQVL